MKKVTPTVRIQAKNFSGVNGMITGGNGFLVYLAKYCRVGEGEVSRWVAMGRRSGDLYPRKLEVGDISRDLLQNVKSH